MKSTTGLEPSSALIRSTTSICNTSLTSHTQLVANRLDASHRERDTFRRCTLFRFLHVATQRHDGLIGIHADGEHLCDWIRCKPRTHRRGNRAIAFELGRASSVLAVRTTR